MNTYEFQRTKRRNNTDLQRLSRLINQSVETRWFEHELDVRFLVCDYRDVHRTIVILTDRRCALGNLLFLTWVIAIIDNLFVLHRKALTRFTLSNLLKDRQ